ncbi:g4794 [Coccomyxa viridis]|uniref:G4794 protein n=1 Tax=Coccomyxa viridis TaxID=1274662 RepID=A0ABP1FY17_9CHLO
MQEGTIAEQGRHSELIQRDGLYAEMWQRQAEAAAIEETRTPAIAEEEAPGMPDSRIASVISLSNGSGQAHGN